MVNRTTATQAELITVTEAAEKTGIPRSTIYRMIANDLIHARKIGAKLWIHNQVLDRLLDDFRHCEDRRYT